MSPGRSSFSMSRLYWNPEHPPPTTATRRPEPWRPSRSMVSLTMAAALSVSLTAAGGSDWVWVCGLTVSVWVSMSAVYSDARRRLGIQGTPAIHGEDFTGDERFAGEEKDGARRIFRRSDAPERNAFRERCGVRALGQDHSAGRDAVPPDLWRPLEREQPGQRGQPCLRRRIMCVSLPHLRRPAHVEERADRSRRGAQVGQRGLHQVEGASQVRGEHRLELLAGDLVRGRPLESGRATDQQVQPAECARRLGDDPLRILRLVSLDQRHAPQERGRLLRLGARCAVVHGDAVSGAVQGQRDRPTEAFRRPCHQGLHRGRIRSLLPAAMGKKSKAGKAKAEPAASEPSPEQQIPISPAPLPLERLDARALGEFLELCFADRRLLELCGELRLYSPGYRLEAMPPNQVARLLADEARAAEDAERMLDKAIREALRNPVLEGKPLTDEHYRDLIELFTGDPLQHLARVAWRALIDDDEKHRAYALSAIEIGIEALDVPAKAKAPRRKPQLPADVQELRKELEEARKSGERAEKERESLREQLVAARADIAEREKTVADVREELSQVRSELTRASAEVGRLTAAGEGRALSDARRLADENRSLSERLRAATEEREALPGQLAQAQRTSAAAPAVAPAPAEEEALPSAEEAATFLIPIFTREFYESIQRWDRRMQRAAFDKVSLLARDWRHGSLRAIALEGLPGYYRIRIATDVRLIYRRGEGNTVEILSLIDREDLDRYIRQARTR